MYDLLDTCKLYNIDVGMVSSDQEKAFDWVDPSFLFSTLRAFGFGIFLFFIFLSLLGLLYRDACCFGEGGWWAEVQRGI